MYFRRIGGPSAVPDARIVFHLCLFSIFSVNYREVFLLQKLVSTEWLESNLNDSSVRIIEVASHPDDSSYREGHVPGAVWWYWKDMFWHETDREFPTPESMTQRLGRA